MPGMRSPDSAVDFKAESSHDVDQQVNFTWNMAVLKDGPLDQWYV